MLDVLYPSFLIHCPLFPTPLVPPKLDPYGHINDLLICPLASSWVQSLTSTDWKLEGGRRERSLPPCLAAMLCFLPPSPPSSLKAKVCQVALPQVPCPVSSCSSLFLPLGPRGHGDSLLSVVGPVASLMMVLTGFSYCCILVKSLFIKFSSVTPLEGAFCFLPDSDQQRPCCSHCYHSISPHSYHRTVCRCLLGLGGPLAFSFQQTPKSYSLTSAGWLGSLEVGR